MQFALIPLDNRPVTYLLPQQICRVAGLSVIAAPRDLLGSLTSPSRPGGLSEWIAETIKNHAPQKLIVCLDSLIYGGLINSRRGEESDGEVSGKLKEIADWKRLQSSPMSVYAQSSIMRISDNYDNTEEKKYWSRYGREIFQWSEMLHKNAYGTKLPSGALSLAESRIEPAVREDYLRTRRRNFKANMQLLDYVKSSAIDFLVFSQDDSGEFGLNKLEQEKLLRAALDGGIARKVMSYAGSDETILTLVTRALLESAARRPRVSIQYSSHYGSRNQSRYEGQTIGDSVEKHTHAAGLHLINENDGSEDFQILIHCAEPVQGDHIFLAGQTDLRQINTNAAVKRCIEILENAQLPVVLCDLAYANGGDPTLIDELLKRPDLLAKLWSYAGWNTSGNSLGSAIALGVARWYSRVQGESEQSNKAFRETMLIRLADDWAYQTQVRPQLNGSAVPDSQLAELMKPYLNQISSSTGWQIPAVRVCLPWQRTFEIEISIPN